MIIYFDTEATTATRRIMSELKTSFSYLDNGEK